MSNSLLHRGVQRTAVKTLDGAILRRHTGGDYADRAPAFREKTITGCPLPAAQIALSAGFGSVCRFNALFHARYALSPTNLRRSAKRGTHSVRSEALESRLSHRLPLAGDELLAYLARRAVPGVERVDLEQKSDPRTIAMGGRVGWALSSVSQGKDWLDVTLPVSLAEVSWPILTPLCAPFDLNANPASIDAHSGGDPPLGPSVQNHPGLRVRAPGAPLNWRRERCSDSRSV